MFPPDIEALARAIIPGEGAVSLRRLGTGLFNSTYRAVRDGLEYALRVPADSAPISQDRAWEIGVLERAGREGLAPPLIHADGESGVLLLGWVRGGTWSEAGARSPEAIEQMARLLRAIHALRIPTPSRRLDADGWVACYTTALCRQTSSAAAEFAEAAARAIRSLNALPQAVPVICHSDLHRLNVLQRDAATQGHKLLLLDWEYAHVADGYWDLAGWSANNDLPEAAQRALLAAYGGAPATESQWVRFRLQFWLYDYICLLWIELYVRLRPADSAAIATRAPWLERRLR
jgi:aminoglycoside phosphotransferase (APT) family kinase protein